MIKLNNELKHMIYGSWYKPESLLFFADYLEEKTEHIRLAQYIREFLHDKPITTEIEQDYIQWKSLEDVYRDIDLYTEFDGLRVSFAVGFRGEIGNWNFELQVLGGVSNNNRGDIIIYFYNRKTWKDFSIRVSKKGKKVISQQYRGITAIEKVNENLLLPLVLLIIKGGYIQKKNRNACASF